MNEVEQQHAGWIPTSEADRAAVRAELERLVESALFRNSRRYPALLQYLVEQTLAGNEAALKERLLGVAVFQRPTDYDTNQDTVVRLTAAEVRKRLAQYYVQTEPVGGVRIGLHAGSYVPIFERVEVRNTAPQGSAEAPRLNWRELAGKWRRQLWATALAAVVVAVAGGAWMRVDAVRHHADRQLWDPILNEPGGVQLVLADLSAGTTIDGEQPLAHDPEMQALLWMGELVNYRDTQAESAVVEMLARHQKAFRLVLSSHATYPELQSGASVLVGGLDNNWTLRLTTPLRYHFVRTGGRFAYGIADRLRPQAGPWRLDIENDKATDDYAIVARIFDPTTGRPVMILAGLGANGTAAAAEFLLDSERTAELGRHAPREWRRMNMEAVVRTQVLDNHAGPPHLVACNFW